MFNAGLFSSDVDYGEECENIDKKALPCPFSTIRTDHKLGKVHGNAVYQLNALMETK